MKNTVNRNHMETEKVAIVFSGYTLGVKSGNTHYIFSYTRGGLESLNKNGKGRPYREAFPVSWRAATDNDGGSGPGFKSGIWLGTGLCPKVKEIGALMDNKEIDLLIAPVNNQYSSNRYAGTVGIIFALEINTIPKTQVTASYRIAGEGKTFVKMHHVGQKGLPELLALSIGFIMPTKARPFEYEGSSGETYSDRLAGSIEGIYRMEGLPIPPYLVPQECGMHMETKRPELTRNQTLDNTDKDQEDFSLRFEQQDTPFAFPALPFKAEELEQATHIGGLPPERRTVLTIFAKVRGVGSINSWGAGVESSYHISSEKDHEISFIIQWRSLDYYLRNRAYKTKLLYSIRHEQDMS